MQVKLHIKLTAGCEKLKSNRSNAKNASPTTCKRSKKALKAPIEGSVSWLRDPVTRQRDRADSIGKERAARPCAIPAAPHGSGSTASPGRAEPPRAGPCRAERGAAALPTAGPAARAARGRPGAPRPPRAQARPGPARTRCSAPASWYRPTQGNSPPPNSSTGLGLLRSERKSEPGGSAAGPSRLGSEGTLPAALGSV